MWFTLVLRYFGVSEIISCVSSLVTAYNIHIGYYSSSSTPGAFINHGVASLAIGVVLLLGAPQVSAFLVKALPLKPDAPEGNDPQNV